MGVTANGNDVREISADNRLVIEVTIDGEREYRHTSRVERGADDASGQDDIQCGVKLRPKNVEVAGFRVRFAPASLGFSRLIIQDANANPIQTVDVSDKASQDWAEIRANMEPGSDYYLVIDDAGTSYQRSGMDVSANDDVNYPIETYDFTLVEGRKDGSDNGVWWYAFDRIEALYS